MLKRIGEILEDLGALKGIWEGPDCFRELLFSAQSLERFQADPRIETVTTADPLGLDGFRRWTGIPVRLSAAVPADEVWGLCADGQVVRFKLPGESTVTTPAAPTEG